MNFSCSALFHKKAGVSRRYLFRFVELIRIDLVLEMTWIQGNTFFCQFFGWPLIKLFSLGHSFLCDLMLLAGDLPVHAFINIIQMFSGAVLL